MNHPRETWCNAMERKSPTSGAERAIRGAAWDAGADHRTREIARFVREFRPDGTRRPLSLQIADAIRKRWGLP